MCLNLLSPCFMLLTSHWPSFSHPFNPPTIHTTFFLLLLLQTPPHTLSLSLAAGKENKRKPAMNMMVQPMNPPYSASCQSKAAEIMSRYRPIAPKPAPTAMSTAAVGETTAEAASPNMQQQQAVHLRPLWPRLNQRPTRSRKRGRVASTISLSPSPPTFKRAAARGNHHHPVLPLLRPTHPDHLLAMHFPHCHRLPPFPISVSSAVTAVARGFELEAPSPSPTALASPPSSTVSCLTQENKVMDLNRATTHEVPEEKDLLCQLQDIKTTAAVIITPLPVRPVGSSISIGQISEEPGFFGEVVKRKEEVEEEVEAEAVPVVVSDSNNKVRLANSAYREMVGQPECPWLGLGGGGGGGGGGACRRIGGEVMLHLPEGKMLLMLERFSCWVKIEWLCNGKKSSVNAFCNANRLSCESKDYAFAWRFHTRGMEDCESSN